MTTEVAAMETTMATANQDPEDVAMTIIGDITQSDGQSVPIAMSGSNVTEGQGYIIVPMIKSNQTDAVQEVQEDISNIEAQAISILNA